MSRPWFKKRRLAATLLVPAAALIGLGLEAAPAAAATTSATYTFAVNPPNRPEVSCTITIAADFPFGGPNSGRATTTSSGPAECTAGVETITGAEYRSTTGDFVTEPYTWSYGPTHQHTYTSVARDFQTYHQVYYPACACASQVYVLSTVNPK